jgi:hypothetical protein
MDYLYCRGMSKVASVQSKASFFDVTRQELREMYVNRTTVEDLEDAVSRFCLEWSWYAPGAGEKVPRSVRTSADDLVTTWLKYGFEHEIEDGN